MNVVVTGAAGYIGGQIVIRLLEAGHKVLAIDHRKKTVPWSDNTNFSSESCDFASDRCLRALLKFEPRAIVHCAGTSLVGPSMANPEEYYNNNTVKTKQLLDFVRKAMPHCRVIFSSSAAVYGEPIMNPCHEVDPCEPISPYGESKRMIELMLASYRRAYNLDYVAFRYFNACGADPSGKHGQEPGATHIIARVLESLRDDREFVLNGVDYDTPDGTCVRDYVHVDDIAQAHVMALDNNTVPAGIYNLGSHTGISNAEIILTAERVTGRKLRVQSSDRRQGDPAMLTASAEKFDKLVAWRQYNLDDIITHAWQWYV
jgi:UDP-glucose 4-epimerase